MSLSKYHKKLILNRIYFLDKKSKLIIEKGFYSGTYSIVVPKKENSKVSHKILFIVKRNSSDDFELITKKISLNLTPFTEKEKLILLKGKILHTSKKIFFIHKMMNTVLSITTNSLKDFLKNRQLKFKKSISLYYTYNKVLSSSQIEAIAMGKNVTLAVNVFTKKNISKGIITKTITVDPSFFRGVNSFNLKTIYPQILRQQNKRNQNV
ncbi:hypothetical protein LNJ05_11760 [Tenacibaculum finnmarkense genomovar ulcerans]|uniref:hypothetical protein n=1 Tax=Tenacibaculum finnmarkense TaxID=2781243 RepID=UPI00187BA056|nr:hypothetical protein [Tenacibaculum finnmarkense]MBE7634981.1 hypothetical protein [Tenacibaculum finnmarkense genomovar ulcerans]MCD8401356.1 hypothetical protein [Tenacibaculum finnmarkense genomovar ulcerans]MCD8403796.1 hypothetical protein [Tenacibaculum finnmarkense genomovar finnmarkense]MCD8430894.1 hypothetical protein [Tenacibaculum finnmarkense genomovar ulcerans]MCD8433437.1 hypothetical protein [Tenacibaculum finnmarkense genomovar ulcerans]